MGADVVARAPDDGGDEQAVVAVVEDVGAVVGAASVSHGGYAVLFGYGVGVVYEPFEVRGAAVEQGFLVGLVVHKGVHVVDEFVEGVFYGGGHGMPP